jgi:hypothetical protein
MGAMFQAAGLRQQAVFKAPGLSAICECRATLTTSHASR